MFPSEEEIDRQIVERGGLAAFARLAFGHVLPGIEYEHNWHIDVMCKYLELFLYGHIRDLIIEVPPGSMKTLLTGVFFPAWAWIYFPSLKYIYATYSGKRSLKAARMHRDLVNSTWYQARWGILRKDEKGRNLVSIPHQNTHAASYFENLARGFRFSTSTKGEATGEHADILAGDDLNKAQDAIGSAAFSVTNLDSAWEFWSQVLPSRQGSPKKTRKLMIGQRLHEKDCPGRWKKLDPGVVVLCLPMRYDPTHPHLCPEDPRTDEGELLWPAHMDEHELGKLERLLGPLGVAAQMQQRPGSVGGKVFRPTWFQSFWKEMPSGCFWLQSWDHSFGSEGESSSWVVGQIWAAKGADYYLVDQVRFKGEVPEMETQLETTTAKHRMASTKLVENKAAGSSIIQTMKRVVSGIIPVQANAATGGKLARAQSITGVCEAGNIHLPHPTEARLYGKKHPCPWVHDWRARVCNFRGVKSDIADEVDSMSQAIRYFEDRGSRNFEAAMDRVRRKQ